MTAITMNGILIQDDDGESCLHQPFPPSRQQSSLDINQINLSVVNEAYGNDADLYIDVLRVKPNALSAQIQEAYFDRRNEIFLLLSKIDLSQQLQSQKLNDNNKNSDNAEYYRQMGERKLDAIVCAVRILGDPDLRLQYDEIRSERIRCMSKSPASSTTTKISKNTRNRHVSKEDAGDFSPITDQGTLFYRENEHRCSPSCNDVIGNKYSSRSNAKQLSPSPLPDVVNLTGISSANTTGYIDFFTADESKNITQYFESTLNTTNYFETTSNSYYSTQTDIVDHQKNIDSKIKKEDKQRRLAPQLKEPKKTVVEEKSVPIPFTSSHRRNLPAPAPQLQRRVISNSTYTTASEGDGSNQLSSKESTVYYDDDDDDDDEAGDEDETYYSIDEDDNVDDDVSTIEQQQQRKSSNDKSIRGKGLSKKQKRRDGWNNPFSSCMDDGMDRVRVEILEAIDDTASAFEQVFNAFTLQDDDINGVVGRIDKAKRQISQTYIFYPSSSTDYTNEEVTSNVNTNIKSKNLSSKSKKSKSGVGSSNGAHKQHQTSSRRRNKLLE